VIAGLAARSRRRQGGQVAVPNGWHAEVEIKGIAEEFLRPLVVASGTGGLSVKDQLPGGDLLSVLLP
jgi:hypothetical protein